MLDTRVNLQNGRTASEPAWGYTVDLCGFKEPCIRWGQISHENGHFLGAAMRPFANFLDTYYRSKLITVSMPGAYIESGA